MARNNLALLLLVGLVSACSSAPKEEPQAPYVKTNFNVGGYPSSSAYPQGKNAERDPEETLASELNKPNPFICFGQSCVCPVTKKNTH